MSTTITITESRSMFVASLKSETGYMEHCFEPVVTHVDGMAACKAHIAARCAKLIAAGYDVRPTSRIDREATAERADGLYGVRIEARYDEKTNRILSPTKRQLKSFSK